MKRCLDCPRFVGNGSRCERCRLAHERQREQARGPRRDGALHAKWARAVKERDGGRCRICGATRRIEAHHIKRLADGGGYSLGNGVTLCRTHHLEMHRA